MRLITAAGLLVLSTGPALGAYLVDLDAGDRMTVDSYWEDGDRVHLLRGGVDLIVPRRRIRSLKEASGAEGSANSSAGPASTPPRSRPRARRARRRRRTCRRSSGASRIICCASSRSVSRRGTGRILPAS